MNKSIFKRLLAPIWLFASLTAADGQQPATEAVASVKNYLIGGQITVIGQTLFPFHSPYSGANSFGGSRMPTTDWTDTYTLFLGYRPVKGLELYVDPEMARGSGVGGAVGLGGYTNGDVLRVPGAGIGALPQSPYLARYFVRYTVSTGHGQTDLAAGENQIPGRAPAERLVVTAGKLSVADIFDANSYANSTRTQFMNWALLNDPAYDYAADTRGYTDGGVLEWIHPGWVLRAGAFEMPIIPNGPVLATHWNQDQGDQIEAEFHPQLGHKMSPSIIRFLSYRNIGHMGNYRDAVAAAGPGQQPNLAVTETDGAVKYGFGLNIEQALGDGGDTGVFARLGWDDGATESFCYTECDDHLSLGAQVSGTRWRSKRDKVGVAVVSDGLSAAHRDYLAAGGEGFLLGDGRLNYGREMILETYWQRALTKLVSFTVDYQFIANPGYNQDRGPVSVASARLHFEF